MTVSCDGRWNAAPYSYADALVLVRELGLSETLATVLVRRGLADPAAARAFLDATESHDAFAFAGMEEAVGLILSHVERGHPIAVHGDYDVDGVCSTAVLVTALRDLGAEVRPRLPSRSEDGYGLSRRTVEELRARGAGLLVTVDCGIGAVEEVAFARSLGMDVVVTDHHRPGDELPACPIVHPVVCGYPCEELCATGVAFKLAEALFARAGRDPGQLERELDIVALATVADLVPLRGENRSLVRRGLRALHGARRPGLRELMRVVGVDPQSVTEQTLGFGLAPRINAAGRLYRADAGLELVLTDDEERAREIARELDAVNSERQAVETGILLEAEEQLASAPERLADPVHVLAGEGWHPGVVGIVASRLVERYHRPFVLIGLAAGRGRGSARSISAYDLHAGLASASEHLERFGGHRMAAGVELTEEQLAPFRAALLAHAGAALRPEDLARTEHVDAIVPGDAVGLELAEQLQAMRPFGMGNPAVRLLLPGARLGELRPMGEGKHARFTIASAGVRARAVAFGVGDSLGDAVGDGSTTARHDITARLEINEWAGAVEPRLVVNAVHSVPEPDRDGAGGCSECTCRARAERWWDAVFGELDAPLERPVVTPRGDSARTVLDRRGEGVLGTLSELLSTGEPLLVACADVSRRRALFARELAPERFARSTLTSVSARCARDEVAEPVGVGAALCLAEHGALEHEPGLQSSLPGRFRHVFILDPSPFPHVVQLLSEGTPAGGGESFLHLGWGEAELDFSRQVLEHEFSLRASLSALYRGLAAAGGTLAGAALETLLAGDGAHPRSPAHAARSLRVLTELGLVAVERSSATVKCTIISEERVELERSSAFRAYSRICEEGLKFLNEWTPQTGARTTASQGRATAPPTVQQAA